MPPRGLPRWRHGSPLLRGTFCSHNLRFNNFLLAVVVGIILGKTCDTFVFHRPRWASTHFASPGGGGFLRVNSFSVAVARGGLKQMQPFPLWWQSFCPIVAVSVLAAKAVRSEKKHRARSCVSLRTTTRDTVPVLLNGSTTNYPVSRAHQEQFSTPGTLASIHCSDIRMVVSVSCPPRDSSMSLSATRPDSFFLPNLAPTAQLYDVVPSTSSVRRPISARFVGGKRWCGRRGRKPRHRRAALRERLARRRVGAKLQRRILCSKPQLSYDRARLRAKIQFGMRKVSRVRSSRRAGDQAAMGKECLGFVFTRIEPEE
eukprot:TRINITY_DN61959_c0_g1_i1.p1 TRINITY_DN61959_c0_g1~~TRINITY_DN61959_c0_g1_i1.p1  ORF type:complete len:315 (-),score=33.36 TRINITY_DN61959_c0_g1_i1:160-1104(-)